MCGIIAYVGQQNATSFLLDGLKRLEYRGYDSAGIALIDVHGRLRHAKEQGKVSRLETQLQQFPLEGSIGIAHTRWATHGAPEQRNAHPHMAGNVAIVHNGIIENYHELKEALQADGITFESDTDSEVICQWLNQVISQGSSMPEAFKALLPLLKGAYSIVALHTSTPDTLYAAKQGSPMLVGVSDEANWIASDALALSGCADKGYYLNDGDYAIVTSQQVTIYDANHANVAPELTSFNVDENTHDKGSYAHFMLKEIYEQPAVLRKTIHHYYDAKQEQFTFGGIIKELAQCGHITIIACGTSFYAAQVASYWLEQLAHIPVRIEIASEFRYREPRLPAGGAALCISQSGETADTLAALRYCKKLGQKVTALVNVTSSTMAREADSMIKTLAGAEIGVASTKAFTAQLTTLACLTLAIAKEKQTIDNEQYHQLLHGLSDIADKMEQVLADSADYDALALALMYAKDMLFIGRGTSYPLANEGALKMKEISYIHAEGYAAGELKHGPIALVDDGVPIIVIAPDDALFDKTASNLEETAARKGNIVLISSSERIASFKGNVTHSAALPHCDAFHAPILYALPLQLLSYYVALHKGANIDQPRNLAKSVTVE